MTNQNKYYVPSYSYLDKKTNKKVYVQGTFKKYPRKRKKKIINKPMNLTENKRVPHGDR